MLTPIAGRVFPPRLDYDSTLADFIEQANVNSNHLSKKLAVLLLLCSLLAISIGPSQAAAQRSATPTLASAVSQAGKGGGDSGKQQKGGSSKGGQGGSGAPMPPSKGLTSKTPGGGVTSPVGGLIGATPRPTRVGSEQDGGTQSSSDIESQMIVQTNAARRAHGVPPLHQNDNLAAAAHWLAGDMATHNYFSHTDSQGRTFDVRLAQFNYWHGNGGIAENIAAGYSDVPSVVSAWLNSPGHAQNMLNPVYREMGMGYAENSGSTYDTYWVQDFGFDGTVFPVIINDEQPQTNSSVAHLYIYGSGWADAMMISNDANFTGVGWQPYQSEMDWQLLPGNGLRAVFVKLHNASGATTTAEDTIVVNLPPSPTPQPTPTECAGQLFPDVSCTYWDYHAIQSLARAGIVTGKGDGDFHPRDAVTRAEFAKMIVIANGWSLLTPSSPHFSDVPANYWAYAFIETAYVNGAISGFGDTTFRPAATLSRDQLAKIIVRALGYGVYSPSSPSFSDVPTTYWAYGYIEQAHHLNLINGYPNGSFQPASISKRDELSAILFGSLSVPTPTP